MFTSRKDVRPYHLIRIRLPKRMPRKLFKWARMDSNYQYDLVDDDEYDIKIPLHPDEAFQCGISFHAKYIGTLDVPRPASRVEIVTAMRRVRYEFKSSGVKKRKVTVDVSIDGVRVTTRKKLAQTKKGSRMFGGRYVNTGPVEIMHHPIYRIFYVSHDSSDLKIFSYIARDNTTNAFKCNVFKSNKRSQAMKIVRTVGQAFEVCHKLAQNQEPQPGTSTSSQAEDNSDRAADAASSREAVSVLGSASNGAASANAVGDDRASVPREEPRPQRPQRLELLPPPPRTDRKRSPMRGTAGPVVGNLIDLPECIPKVEAPPTESSVKSVDLATPLSDQHQLQLLRERLEQQSQQTQAAVAQLLLLRNQLAAEQAARCEAQTRTHQLLVHNKELLEHIAALVSHLQDRERGSSGATLNAQHLTLLPQILHSNTAVGVNGAAAKDDLSPEEDGFLEIMRRANIATQNIENNNVAAGNQLALNNGSASKQVSFGGMSNNQIQNYLVDKFDSLEIKPEKKGNKKMSPNNNRELLDENPNIRLNFTNRNLPDNPFNNDAFDFRLNDLEVQRSMISLSSTDESSDSEDDVSFIKPLSHNATLAATGDDGKVRLIVPVSPSTSATNVVQIQALPQDASGNTLRVPALRNQPSTSQGAITRASSEKVPNRSEMMEAMRAQWTRHTTK